MANSSDSFEVQFRYKVEYYFKGIIRTLRETIPKIIGLFLIKLPEVYIYIYILS